MVKSEYEVEWLTSFLHNFPHINFDFREINSTFDPEYKDYQQVRYYFKIQRVLNGAMSILARSFVFHLYH